MKKADGIGVITFATPKRLNAISEQRLDELEAVLAEAEADQTLRALILTGEGERAFCVGLDLALLEKAFADLSYFQVVGHPRLKHHRATGGVGCPDLGRHQRGDPRRRFRILPGLRFCDRRRGGRLRRWAYRLGRPARRGHHPSQAKGGRPKGQGADLECALPQGPGGCRPMGWRSNRFPACI